MKRHRQKGFVLLFVIMLITVFGLEMFVLAGGSNTILFQTDTAYLQAVQRNLVTSALGWAKQNIRSENENILDKKIELDVNDMSFRCANLHVLVTLSEDKQPIVQINTSCSRARQHIEGEDKYKIKL